MGSLKLQISKSAVSLPKIGWIRMNNIRIHQFSHLELLSENEVSCISGKE